MSFRAPEALRRSRSVCRHTVWSMKRRGQRGMAGTIPLWWGPYPYGRGHRGMVGAIPLWLGPYPYGPGHRGSFFLFFWLIVPWGYPEVISGIDPSSLTSPHTIYPLKIPHNPYKMPSLISQNIKNLPKNPQKPSQTPQNLSFQLWELTKSCSFSEDLNQMVRYSQL